MTSNGVRAVGADHVFWTMETDPEAQLATTAELRRSI